jgi:hypothetical protein
MAPQHNLAFTAVKARILATVSYLGDHAISIFILHPVQVFPFVLDLFLLFYPAQL